ncbi:MAG: hypothetical protein KUG77_27935 [Nannocystaceae bacterium]|nr:hypothetical protein [Nannocystaceae bacterium]
MSETSPAAKDATESARGASESSEDAPPANKRRRRRRRGGRNKTATPEAGVPAAVGEPAPALDPGIAALAGGLLSHIDDRDVACSNEGCNNVWQWTATEQIAAYGQSPPRRECARCTSTSASEIRCSVDGCKRTWSWSRDAQIKHRSWNKRRGDDRSSGRKRRRRADGPPRRKCEPCQAKLEKLTERPSACKVHGCTRPVLIDRDVQLRAWAASGKPDINFDAALPKQMCEVCREFCRTHDDRGVPCGRPGCEKSWSYKRGAQLQAFLAGRFEDPIRLCEGCESETRKAGHASGMPANTDVMPCIVPGCDGVWHFRAGQKIPGSQDGEQPVQRMCDDHRKANGAEPRMKPPQGQNAPPETETETETEVAAAVPEQRPESDPQVTSASDPIS